MVACRKGGVKHVAAKVAEVIGNLGYEKVVLKSDQEPAIVDLQTQVKSMRWKQLEEISKNIKSACGNQVVLEHSPVGGMSKMR